MDDRLEKFVRKHRDEMDEKSPSNDLWQKIQGDLKSETRQRSLGTPMVYWRAAAVILLLITSWLVLDRFAGGDVQNDNQQVAVAIHPELQEAEYFYVSLISEKRQEIRDLSQKYDLGEDFLKELDELDTMYDLLKKDLANGDEENLIDAMIRNLQLQIEILNQQLIIIKSIEKGLQDETVNL